MSRVAGTTGKCFRATTVVRDTKLVQGVKVTLRQLDYFLALARAGSYKEAGNVCGITQSTLSLMIIRLEDDLGAVLFDRSANPVRLTPIGLRLKSHARAIVRNVDQMRELVQHYGEDSASIVLDDDAELHAVHVSRAGAPARMTPKR